VPALLPTRFNADLTASNQVLIAAGKALQLAITAIVRKPLVLADALLRDCPAGETQYSLDQDGFSGS
jgi:transposase